jgi:hypothetical protein
LKCHVIFKANLTKWLKDYYHTKYLVIILFRRKTIQRQRKVRRQSQIQMTNAENSYELTGITANYSVVNSRKGPQRSQREKGAEEESPYSEGKDGVYDHLRDNQARWKQPEGVYDHASLVTSNYAEVNAIRNDRTDGIYDRCKPCPRNTDNNAYDRADIGTTVVEASVSSEYQMISHV